MIGNLKQLRHLVALAETGSFTQAAQRCHLSQPAFSRSIAVLEHDLGVTLVDRVGKQSELTLAGRSVLEHARHVIFEFDELARSVALHAAGRTGRFRLGLGATPSALLMTPLLSHAAKHHSTLRLTLSRGPIAQQVEALRTRHLDAMVVDMRSVPPTPDLHIEQVAELRTSLLCRAGHPLARRRKPLAFADLGHYAVACTPVSDEVTRMLVNAFGPEAHPSEFVTLCSEDVASLLEATRTSDAIYAGVVAPGWPLIDSGKLVELNLSGGGFEARFALVRLAGRTVPPVFTQMRDYIKEKMRDRAARQPRG